MAEEQVASEGDGLFGFDARFLQDHAGAIVTDPGIALTELVANAYDAGAQRVDLAWPADRQGQFTLSDNGTGMTTEDFRHRWSTLCYDRLREQGNEVEFPPRVRPRRPREPFGHNGKGRFGAFCFADRYQLITRKDGVKTSATIVLTPQAGLPFKIEDLQTSEAEGHGTQIIASIEHRYIGEDKVRDLLASRFLVDPEFRIAVNGVVLQFVDISGLQTSQVPLGSHGSLTVHRIDPGGSDRTTNLHGISWWVRGRMVGLPSWDFLEGEGSYLDGRSAEAKRYTFVVVADCLPRTDIKQDWSWFHANERTQAAVSAAHVHVADTLADLTRESRRRRKQTVLEQNREYVEQLTPLSQKAVASFVDELQERCTTMSPKDLGRAVEVFAKFEEARSGYDLLRQLAQCSPGDLDAWNDIMEKWSASNAKLVLGELERRLKLVRQLQSTVETAGIDELHDIHPVIERGLWIFGAPYEAVDFRSNRRMSTIIREFFGRCGIEASDRRPDIIALADSTVVPYAAEEFGDDHEVVGYREVLIVELKTTGGTIAQKEVDQARDYAVELKRKGVVGPDTKIVGYVLGTNVDPFASKQQQGSIEICALTYQAILDRAHRRTFFLQRRIEETAPAVVDSSLQEVLGSNGQADLYATSG